jgi:hypothetical protein
MEARKVYFRLRGSKLFLASLSIVACVLTTANFRVASTGIQEKKKLSIQSARPVAEAIRALERNCGCAITYEDPFYVHPSEIDDVTESVRRDLDKFPPGQAPRVFVPKSRSLDFEYDLTLLKRSPTRVVQNLVAANKSQGNPGRFRVEKRGQVIHVIATAFKNNKGRLTPQDSVLDTVISPPSFNRPLQVLREICTQLSQKTQTRVMLGAVPLNRLVSYQELRETEPQKARDILVRLLGPNSSWQLFYGPGTKMYVLNIHPVR